MTSVLVFDLGGVLVDFAGFRELDRLVSQETDINQLRRRWLSSPSVHAYEAGKITSDAFATDFVREWEPDLSPPAFLDVFGGWPKRPLPGARELIEQLGASWELACFSNTNALHWESVGRMVQGWFGTELLSFRMGLAKPDPEAFEEASRRLEVDPTEILFFDDSKANVEAALGAGWTAVCVSGPREVAAYLELSEPV